MWLPQQMRFYQTENTVCAYEDLFSMSLFEHFQRSSWLSHVISLELHHENSLNIIHHCAELRSLTLVGPPWMDSSPSKENLICEQETWAADFTCVWCWFFTECARAHCISSLFAPAGNSRKSMDWKNKRQYIISHWNKNWTIYFTYIFIELEWPIIHAHWTLQYPIYWYNLVSLR